MSNRLDQEREKELQPKRVQYALFQLQNLGYIPTCLDGKKIQFIHNCEVVNFWPYSGWHSGKSIKDGRGIKNLLNQLTE